MDVQLEIPELQVAEYHRPYVAVFLESDKGRHQRDLAVWYDHNMRNHEGNKWLKDLRLWWRRSGRSLDMPVDGFTGATRAPGVHSLELVNIGERLESLQPGDYNLVVEASREVGGREVVRVPLTWPPEANTQLTARGESELGAVTVTLNP